MTRYTHIIPIHPYEDAEREQFEEEEAKRVIARQLAKYLSEKRITVRLVKREPTEQEIDHFRHWSNYQTEPPYIEYMLEVNAVEERVVPPEFLMKVETIRSARTRSIIRELLRRVVRPFTPDHVRRDVNEFDGRYRWQNK